MSCHAKCRKSRKMSQSPESRVASERKSFAYSINIKARISIRKVSKRENLVPTCPRAIETDRLPSEAGSFQVRSPSSTRHTYPNRVPSLHRKFDVFEDNRGMADVNRNLSSRILRNIFSRRATVQ